MSVLDKLYEQAHRRLRFLPGLIVLAVVLVLLHGFTGAVEVLWDLGVSFLAAIVGGGDHAAVANVLWRTLPLALAAAGVTFVVANRWIRPGSSHSYVWVSLIVLTGAVVGNAAYEQFGSRTVVVNDPVEQLSPPIVAKTQAVKETNPAPTSLSDALAANQHALERISIEQLTVAAPKQNPWYRITTIGWFDKPDLSRKPKPVEPLNLLPPGPGILRGVTGAANQLLGYLVDYEPRLFLASIIAGSFVGWRLQRRVAVAHAVVSGDFSELSEGEVERLAA